MLKKTSMLLAAGAFLALASSAQAITPAPLGAPSDVITVAGSMALKIPKKHLARRP